jgi:N6-adenosine-specific RNA methylase IME4
VMGERGERETQGGDRRSKSQRATLVQTPKLSDLKVTKSQSSRWQRLADMDSNTFEARVEGAKRKAVNIVDGAGRRTRQEMHAEDEERVKLLRPVPGTFLTQLIDPPLESEWLSDSARKTPGYATMTPEQLLALPVPQWAAENCHLYLCSPNNFLPLCHKLVAHWGFAYKSMLTWKKPRWGQGHYFRNQTEHVLFAVKGELRTRSDSIPTIFEGDLPPGALHSEKPEALYQIIRKASYPPYGEAFQRRARPDFRNLFAAIGNELLSRPDPGGTTIKADPMRAAPAQPDDWPEMPEFLKRAVS